MQDLLFEEAKPEKFSLEKIEECILKYGTFIKGLEYERTLNLNTNNFKNIDKWDIFDNKFKKIELDETLPDKIKFCGAVKEKTIVSGENTLILAKLEGDFLSMEGKKYKEIYVKYLSVNTKTLERQYDWDIFSLYYNPEKIALEFYLPGIEKELNNKGFDIKFNGVRKTDEYWSVKITKYNVYRSNTGIFNFYSESKAKELVKFLIKNHYYTDDINIDLNKQKEEYYRYTEDESNIDIHKLVRIMNKFNIDFDHIKVKHSGLSSAIHSGLFEKNTLPDFISFLTEAKETTSTTPNRDTTIYYLNNLARLYSTATSAIKNSNFENLGEKVRLQELRLHVKDKETKTCNGFREIICKINDEDVTFRFDFDVKFSGQIENDAPDPIAIDPTTVFVRVEDIIPTKFEIISPKVNKLYTKFSPELLNAIKIVLISLFEPWYDILGKNLEQLKITQI